jgi:hypothetical protein
MNVASRVTLGPFFIADRAIEPSGDLMAPLNLTMEWATEIKATSIPLFRPRVAAAPDRIRFEQVLFRHQDLPYDLECQRHQAVHTPGGIFLPLDSLLAELYRVREITRPICQLLNDFTAVVPLWEPLTNSIATVGLLEAGAESHGFRLNAVFRDSGLIYAQIGWESKHCASRFHVRTAVFKLNRSGKLSRGKWIPNTASGVCKLLTDELQRLVPGPPSVLLSQTGHQLLLSPSPPAPVGRT